MRNRTSETHRFERDGLLLEIQYDPCWLPGGVYGRDMTKLLDSLSFDRRYLKPDHLYKHVEQHLADQSHGILWLAMPAHTGKTMFARAIGDPLVADKWRLEANPLIAAGPSSLRLESASLIWAAPIPRMPNVASSGIHWPFRLASVHM